MAKINELVTELSHLIIEEVKSNCFNGQTSDYCSHYGIKLK